MGRVMGTVTSHTSMRMRMARPSAGERTGVRTGEARAGMENMGAWTGPEVKIRDHKQRTTAEKTGKGIMSVDGERRGGG